MSVEYVPLRYVTSVLARGTAPNYVDDGPVRMVSQAANQDSGLDWERTRFHEFAGDPRKLKGYLEFGDSLVNSTGTGTLGRVGWFEKSPDERPCVADGHVTVTRFDPTRVDKRFGFYYLKSDEFQEFMFETLVNGSTNQIELSRERMGAVSMPVPPLEEQRRIADFLDAETARIDKFISALIKELKLFAERRSAGVAHLVAGGDATSRRRSTLAWLTSVPEHWEEVRLGLVARMGSGHTPSRNHPEWWVDCNIPWVTTGEVSQLRDDRLEDLTDTREKISEIGLENSAAELHPKGTVFLCRTAASAGYSGVMGLDMATSQDIVTWTCGPRLTPYYLLWCLRAMRPDLLGRLAMGSTHKTIYVPDLQMLRIPLPSVDEQRRIVEAIRKQNRRLDALSDNVQRQRGLLSERRQALITAAVTGEFDVSAASGRGIEE
ncbi:restriction endonuclease subunit S [Saccharomonospora halophila]|uniref:restriction endonuclease subunit S n=1 Tax=Saccharomonospora halophila TaxID=129922 RepID=UPI00039DD045|nr:restriction endonuclease subunit S [Saccharomonospora halophila]